VVAGTIGEGAVLASVHSVGVGSVSHCGAGKTCELAALATVLLDGVVSASHYFGGQDMLGSFSGFCSIGRRGISQPLWWRARQVRALLCSLFASSAWGQPNTVVAGTTGEGAAQASVQSFGVG
jgi:hypothetical protein